MDTEQLVVDLLRGESPTRAAGTEERREQRIPCDPPVPVDMVVAVDIVIPVGGGFAAIKAHVVNVSKSGLGIRAKEPVQKNTQISVKMKGVWITGKVRYCVQIDTSLYDMGLQVSDVSEGGKSLDRFPAF
jgi:hypothetical protein